MARLSPSSRPVGLSPRLALSFLVKTLLIISADSGVAQGWGTATECQAAACGAYAAHEYINTKLIMDVADPNYSDTKGTTGASGDMVTIDGGKTWTIASIKIQEGNFS